MHPRLGYSPLSALATGWPTMLPAMPGTEPRGLSQAGNLAGLLFGCGVRGAVRPLAQRPTARWTRSSLAVERYEGRRWRIAAGSDHARTALQRVATGHSRLRVCSAERFNEYVDHGTTRQADVRRMAAPCRRGWRAARPAGDASGCSQASTFVGLIGMMQRGQRAPCPRRRQEAEMP
jgi:hypothetical protein